MSNLLWQAARDVVTVWDDLDGAKRRLTNEHVDHRLYKALHGLSVAIEAADDTEYPIGAPEVVDHWSDADTAALNATNGASGVTDFAPLLGDLMERRHVRASALHHARKASIVMIDYDVHQQALNITTLAQAFEKYLTDGTVHQVPTNPTAMETL